MRTFEELKAKYDKMKVAKIEQEAKNTQGEAKDLYVALIEILFYLERSGRYAENPKYKKSKFEQYVVFEFGIHHKTYTNHRKAYLVNPDIATRHSPNLYALTQKKCGESKVPTVFKEIQKKEQTLKRPIRKDEIQTIINKYAKPVTPKPKTPDVLEWQDKAIKAQETLKVVEKEAMSKDQQITKLKAAVVRLQKENDDLRKERDELLNVMAPLAGIFKERMGEQVAVQ